MDNIHSNPFDWIALFWYLLKDCLCGLKTPAIVIQALKRFPGVLASLSDSWLFAGNGCVPDLKMHSPLSESSKVPFWWQASKEA